MKKMFLTMVLAITVLFAGQPQKPMTPKQKALKNTMKTLSKGLTEIQQGILYNNKTRLKLGIRMIKRTQDGFLTRHGEALKKYMPQNPQIAMALAKTSEKNIERYIRIMRSDIFSRNDYSNIAGAYGHIMQECVGCHQKLRKWRWRP